MEHFKQVLTSLATMNQLEPLEIVQLVEQRSETASVATTTIVRTLLSATSVMIFFCKGCGRLT